jgi:hypothetical protein
MVKHAEQAGQKGTPFDINSLAISGGDLIRELHLSPGPNIGQLQRFLLNQILDQGQEINTRESLLLLARQYLKN